MTVISGTAQPLVVGVEIGGTKLQAALGHGDGQVVELKRLAADAAGGAAAIREQVRALVEPWTKRGDVAALGIGFGGPIDEAASRVTRSNQVGGWEGFEFAPWARDTLGIACAAANDSDLAAWAEARLGAGRGSARVFYTNIGSGIGGGLVVNGERYTAPGGSMEFGQTWAYSELERRWDRLENLCSGWALAARSKQLLPPSDGDAVQTLLHAWQRGDAAATRLVNDFLETYGRALANAVALLNPDAVVIGGGVAQFGDPLINGIRDAVNCFAFEPFKHNFNIAQAALGEGSVPIGALMLAGRLQH
jgi:glucokinase